jgi:hypothetical protein
MEASVSKLLIFGVSGSGERTPVIVDESFPSLCGRAVPKLFVAGQKLLRRLVWFHHRLDTKVEYEKSVHDLCMCQSEWFIALLCSDTGMIQEFTREHD